MTSIGIAEFWNCYHALPPEMRAAAQRAYRKFAVNPAHPGLRLERLTSEARFWSVRVTLDCRAVAQRLPDDAWVWIWIGSHHDFDRIFRR